MAAVPRANELLGYPANARLLIVNADDFGMCHGQNLGAIRSITEGLVSSCSLMAPTPWCLHAAEFLRRQPEVSFAVHLTVVSEYRNYRWGPLAPPVEVPSLLDESGCFFGDDRFDELLATADIGELETEFRAQIEALQALGLQPSHLDTHYGPHEFRQDIFDLVFRLAARIWAGHARRVAPARQALAGARLAGRRARRPGFGPDSAGAEGGRAGRQAQGASSGPERMGAASRDRHRGATGRDGRSKASGGNRDTGRPSIRF